METQVRDENHDTSLRTWETIMKGDVILREHTTKFDVVATLGNVIALQRQEQVEGASSEVFWQTVESIKKWGQLVGSVVELPEVEE